MRKRFIALFACSALAASSLAGFAACGGGGTKLTVWGASNQQNLLREQAKAFQEANPDLNVKFEFGICGEGDAYSEMSKDPVSGADVYAFANDQLINLVRIGALAPLNPEVVATIKTTDFNPALESSKVGENYYGYPFTDNGFFLYYDTRVVTPEQAKDLDSIVAACKAKNKKFIFEYTNSWYALSLAYGAGGTYEVTYGGDEGTTLLTETTTLDQVPEGGRYSYAYLAGVKLNELEQQNLTVISTDGDTQIAGTLNSGTFGACVRGVWEASNIKDKLSEKDDEGNVTASYFAATTLPTWKAVDGKTYEWHTFAGYKLWGVNQYSKHVALAHQFASFLASKEQQQIRYEKTNIEPTNLELRNTEAIKNDQAVQAMYAMIDQDLFILQSSFPSSYWTAAENFAKDIIKWNLDDKSDKDINDRVKTLCEGLTADVNGTSQPETPAE